MQMSSGPQDLLQELAFVERLRVLRLFDEAIRKELCEGGADLTGELTKADLEKVTSLDFTPRGGEGRDKLLTDVKGLEKLTKLKYLFLHDNKLNSVKGLKKLTQLKYLYLMYNQLTDVKGLEKLDQLTRLHLQGNPALTKAQIDELQKALPNCKIISDPKK